MCGKLYRAFVNKEIDTEFVNALADLFISSNWELLPVLKTMFKSAHFFDQQNIASLIKNPTECFLDLVRATGVESANVKDRYSTFRYGAANLGMEIFNPINVAGWPGAPGMDQ
ncbi:MAG: DUF1800 family protein [Saprospiraceae bacterium]|nr:DUF1800 family protein [Saprospiraceae bacterium]